MQLAMPPGKRDSSDVRRLWDRLDSKRPAINTAYRQLRKAHQSSGSRRKSAEERAIWREVKLLRSRLSVWDEMKLLVERHNEAPASPLRLIRDENESDPMLVLMYHALHRLANPNNQSHESEERGHFADIPLRIQLFEQLILVSYRLLVARGRSLNARFLDVGCGGGSKVLAATRYFARCDGLEFDPAYAAAAERLFDILEARSCSVVEGDALAYDGYDQFDVIYFYRPIRDNDVLARMEARIIEQARPGTIIIAPYDLFMTPHPDWPCAAIAGPIFVTGVSQAEANAWREDATRTSPGLIKRPKDFAFDPGFWRPILNAAQYSGG